MKQRLYIQDILERIRLIEEFTVDGEQAFLDSVLIQEGVIRGFEVIGEVIKRLAPRHIRKFPGDRLRVSAMYSFTIMMRSI